MIVAYCPGPDALNCNLTLMVTVQLPSGIEVGTNVNELFIEFPDILEGEEEKPTKLRIQLDDGVHA